VALLSLFVKAIAKVMIQPVISLQESTIADTVVVSAGLTAEQTSLFHQSPGVIAPDSLILTAQQD
jgi:hypothetical protein